MQHETSNVGKGNVEAVSVAIPAVMRAGGDGKQNFIIFYFTFYLLSNFITIFTKDYLVTSTAIVYLSDFYLDVYGSFQNCIIFIN